MAESGPLSPTGPRSADPEVVALAGFLAGYGGRTREAYALDLRQFFAWCTERHLRLFDAHRTDIELSARELEERGKARATLGRLSTIVGFCRYAAEEGVKPIDAATPARRSRLRRALHAQGLPFRKDYLVALV